jgi:hypothetical protein
VTEKDPYVELLDVQIKSTKALSTEHLSCRRGAMGHAWQPVQPDWDPHTRGVVPVASQCSRCLTIRRQNVSKRFGEQLTTPTYEYPEGYQLRRDGDTKGPALMAQAVRAAFVQRMLKDVNDLPEIVQLDHIVREEAGVPTE